MEFSYDDIKKITIANKAYVPSETTSRNIVRKIADEIDRRS